MTDATPWMIAMARRIAASTVINSDSPDRAKRMILSGEADNWHGVRSALAAIIETQRLIVHSLRHDFEEWPDYVAIADVADAVERGQHYGKDEG